MNPVATAIAIDTVNWKTIIKVLLGLFVLFLLFHYFKKYTAVRILHKDTPYIRCSGSVTAVDARKIKTLVEDANRVLNTTPVPAFIDAIIPGKWLDFVYEKAYNMTVGSSERCKVLKSLIDLNTNQFIAFHNSYLATFSKTFKTSLNDAGITGCTEGQYDLLQARLDRLKLP